MHRATRRPVDHRDLAHDGPAADLPAGRAGGLGRRAAARDRGRDPADRHGPDPRSATELATGLAAGLRRRGSASLLVNMIGVEIGRGPSSRRLSPDPDERAVPGVRAGGRDGGPRRRHASWRRSSAGAPEPARRGPPSDRRRPGRDRGRGPAGAGDRPRVQPDEDREGLAVQHEGRAGSSGSAPSSCSSSWPRGPPARGAEAARHPAARSLGLDADRRPTTGAATEPHGETQAERDLRRRTQQSGTRSSGVRAPVDSRSSRGS